MDTIDIVNQLLEDQYGEFDIDMFMDDSAKVEAFGEIYARIANFKRNPDMDYADNIIELYEDIKSYLEGTLKHYIDKQNLGKAA